MARPSRRDVLRLLGLGLLAPWLAPPPAAAAPTRLYFSSSEVTPVTPSFAAWSEVDGAVRRRMRTSLVADPLANGATLASALGADQLHRQYVSDPLVAGIAFVTTDTVSCQIQGFESAANDNIGERTQDLRVFSRDGLTLRATLILLGSVSVSGAEWATALRNLTFLSAGQVVPPTPLQANYTTVDGDRLVLEVGHQGFGTSIAGTLRFGADSAGTGDLGLNETDTVTTLRPWFESSRELTFEAAGGAAGERTLRGVGL